MADKAFAKELVEILNGEAKFNGDIGMLRSLINDMLSDRLENASKILNGLKGVAFDIELEIDPETREVYFIITGDRFWARLMDFLCGRWTARIGRCLYCKRFFVKRSANQRFCGNKCRHGYRDAVKQRRLR